MSIDVFEVEAEDHASVELPVPLVAGTGTSVQFENLGRVLLRIAAKPISGTSPSVTVTVEESADGSSWSEIASELFTATGSASVSVDSPQAYLRASYSVAAGTWHVPRVSAVPFATAAEGGGSSSSIVKVGSISWDDTDLATLGVLVGDPLAANTYIFALWALVTTAWTTGGPDEAIELALGIILDAGALPGFGYQSLLTVAELRVAPVDGAGFGIGADVVQVVPVLLHQPMYVWASAYLNPSGAASASGAADIYALVGSVA